MSDTQWPLWEVFVQKKTGEPHEHAGSVHAADAEMALQNARDVYARRGGVTSLWVAPSTAIRATPRGSGQHLIDFAIGCVADRQPNDHVRISGCRLHGPSFGQQSQDTIGIQVNRCLYIEISNMEIAGWGGNGIRVLDEGDDEKQPEEGPGQEPPSNRPGDRIGLVGAATGLASARPTLLVGGDTRLLFYGPDAAYAANGSVGTPYEFIRDRAGSVRWIRVNGRIARKDD